jgi:hypothetical protein
VALAICIGGTLAALGAAHVTRAQRLEPKRATTLVVQAPRGGSPTARVDAYRTGLSRTLLPTGTLKVAWQTPLATTIEGAPIVTDAGDVIVTTGRGEVLTLEGTSGQEQAHVSSMLTAPPLGSPALLADRTVAFVSVAGDAIGVRYGALRWKTAIGDGRTWAERGGALALDDGGVAVAAGLELATLDADGAVRARATLDEPVSVPLVAAGGKIAAITTTGKVYLWAPGRDPVRAGTFGAPVDGAAARVDDHTLVAVAGAGQLVELDLARGVAVARMSSQSTLLGPPAFRGDLAYLLAAVPGRTFALTIDGTGHELPRVGVETTVVPSLPDGGTAQPSVPAHTGPLVDTSGTLAFATPEGHVGTVTKDGQVDVLGETLCARSPGLAGGHTGSRGPTPATPAAAYAGLAPAGPATFVVACETGAVFKIAAK